MPTPEFTGTRIDNVTLLRNEVVDFAGQMGPLAGSTDLGPIVIGTAETRVAHGQRAAPRWFPCNVHGLAIIGQTREPDATHLYLYATALVSAVIVVF